jgi:hypothetical protein
VRCPVCRCDIRDYNISGNANANANATQPVNPSREVEEPPPNPNPPAPSHTSTNVRETPLMIYTNAFSTDISNNDTLGNTITEIAGSLLGQILNPPPPNNTRNRSQSSFFSNIHFDPSNNELRFRRTD